MSDALALQAKNLSLWIRDKKLLSEVSFKVSAGEWLGIVGPNGSGKSTLLSTLVGFLSPTLGHIEVEGKDLCSLSPLKRARTLAFIQQEASAMPGFRVSSYLDLAYHPLEGIYDQSLWLRDRDALCEEFQLQDRLASPLAELSGGEKQRVLLVQSLLQRPKILLLDELTNHLDIYYQIEIMKKLQSLSLTKVTVLHDLNLAARFCDRILVLQAGRCIGWGRPSEVFSEESIYALFGVSCEVVRNGESISYIRWT